MLATVLSRIYREPAAVLTFVSAVLTVLVFTEVINAEGAGYAIGGVTALIGLLRYIVTPASEVEVQRKPGLPPTAGPASDIKTGTPVDVSVAPALDDTDDTVSGNDADTPLWDPALDRQPQYRDRSEPYPGAYGGEHDS